MAGAAAAASWAPPEGWHATTTAQGERYRWVSAATPHRMEAFRSTAVRVPMDRAADADSVVARWLDDQVRRDAAVQGEAMNCMPAVLKRLTANQPMAVAQCLGHDGKQQTLRVQYVGVAGERDATAQWLSLVRVAMVGDDAGLSGRRPQLDAVLSHLLQPLQ
jgi:acetylglutamate kinase